MNTAARIRNEVKDMFDTELHEIKENLRKEALKNENSPYLLEYSKELNDFGHRIANAQMLGVMQAKLTMALQDLAIANENSVFEV